MTLPGWVGVREPRGRLGGRYAKNVTICPTQACTKPYRITCVCGSLVAWLLVWTASRGAFLGVDSNQLNLLIFNIYRRVQRCIPFNGALTQRCLTVTHCSHAVTTHVVRSRVVARRTSPHAYTVQVHSLFVIQLEFDAGPDRDSVSESETANASLK